MLHGRGWSVVSLIYCIEVGKRISGFLHDLVRHTLWQPRSDELLWNELHLIQQEQDANCKMQTAKLLLFDV